MNNTLAAQLANLVTARINCEKAGNAEWLRRHTERAEALVKAYMPSGSGFDAGTVIRLDLSSPTRLVFETQFHHMNKNGMYDGWTEHLVAVVATFNGPGIASVSGRNRNDIKEYIAETFLEALTCVRSLPHAENAAG